MFVQSHMVPSHISTWSQQQQYNSAPGTSISAAPTVYRAPQTQEKEITSAPQLRTKGLYLALFKYLDIRCRLLYTNINIAGTTSFVPTALRRPGGVAPAKKPKFAPRSASIGPSKPAPSSNKDSDKAYEKFMREMSGLMWPFLVSSQLKISAPYYVHRIIQIEIRSERLEAG